MRPLRISNENWSTRSSIFVPTVFAFDVRSEEAMREAERAGDQTKAIQLSQEFQA